MIQTGDPLGDGTGGDSIYGRDFEDEFNPAIRHSQPYMLSMANSGPNSNAAQFFITTVATPWLDDKHTIFGKCTGGFDVVHKIETVNVDKHDRPLEKLRILSIEMREL
ncbi:cytochrome P450 monooxygenase 71 [Kappamyces sp. JEL0680]|nr:cytochrome P450 monooxygenase 71 [Kappamyces sp. JEL0680]